MTTCIVSFMCTGGELGFVGGLGEETTHPPQKKQGETWDPVAELFPADRARVINDVWDPRWGSFGPFTTVQTSPAERTSLGQVGHIRKCVFVISADMGTRGKASSLFQSLPICHWAVLDCCQNHVKTNSVVWRVRARVCLFPRTSLEPLPVGHSSSNLMVMCS